MNNNDILSIIQQDINDTDVPDSILPENMAARLSGVKQKTNTAQFAAAILAAIVLITCIGICAAGHRKANIKADGNLFDYIQKPNDYSTLYFRISQSDDNFLYSPYHEYKNTYEPVLDGNRLSSYCKCEDDKAGIPYGVYGSRLYGGVDPGDTDVQVQGVQQGDIIKNDGKYIYTLNREKKKIYTIKALNGKISTISQIDLTDTFYERIQELATGMPLMLKNTADTTPVQPDRAANDDNTDAAGQNFIDEHGITMYKGDYQKQYEEYMGKMQYRMKELYVYGNTIAVVAQKNVSDEYEIGTFNRDYLTFSSKDGFDALNSVQAYAAKPETVLMFYDFSDKNEPKLKNSIAMSGYYISSRLVDGYIYMVSGEKVFSNIANQKVPETFAPTLREGNQVRIKTVDEIYISNNMSNTRYINICGIDMRDSGKIVSSKSLLGGGDDIYASIKNLYIYKSMSDSSKNSAVSDDNDNMSHSETCLTGYSLSKGNIELKTCKSISGKITSSFCMDEYNGCLRLLTTDAGEYTGDGSGKSDVSKRTNLMILDLNLETVSCINDISHGEGLKSVMFDGDIAYFVTYADKTEPLFAVDMSDLQNPRILSSLKIPDFPKFLYSFGKDKLFGVGVNAEHTYEYERQGVKLTMFDVSDKTNIKVESKHAVSTDTSHSKEYYTHYNCKAIFILPEKGIIGFPVTYRNLQYNSGDKYAQDKDISYIFFKYSKAEGFTQLGISNVYTEISPEKINEFYDNLNYADDVRGTYINDYLYVISPFGCLSYTSDTFKQTDKINF